MVIMRTTEHNSTCRNGGIPLKIWLLALGVGVFFSLAQVVNAQTQVSGTIVNQTWTSNNSPYVVVGDILVAVLTINPGVTIVFSNNYAFEIGGVLTARGTPTAPIVFMGTNGGWQGIFFNNAPAGSILDHCIISNAVNSGILITASGSPTIVNCSFVGNSTTDKGGAINATAQTTDLVLDGCTFQNNSASVHGGAIHADMILGVLRIVNGCQFIGNISNPAGAGGGYVGGAVYVTGNVEISDALFTNNTSISQCSGTFGCNVEARGGAVFLESGNATINNCIFVGNSVSAINDGNCFFGGNSSAWGGAIHLNTGTLKLGNTILSYNTANASSCGASALGGALYVNSGSCSAVNITCAYNSAGGIYNAGGTIGITNSILFFDNGFEIAGTTNIVYSDVKGGYAGEGNISLNPLFLSHTDLIIVDGSPCIDAGSTNSAYDDVCFPPSLGTSLNDMGAHGGPGACATLVPHLEPQFEVAVFGCVPGYDYLIQASTNLTEWQTVETFQITNVGNAAYFFEPSTNTLPRRFYQLNLGP